MRDVLRMTVDWLHQYLGRRNRLAADLQTASNEIVTNYCTSASQCHSCFFKNILHFKSIHCNENKQLHWMNLKSGISRMLRTHPPQDLSHWLVSGLGQVAFIPTVAWMHLVLHSVFAWLCQMDCCYLLLWLQNMGFDKEWPVMLVTIVIL